MFLRRFATKVDMALVKSLRQSTGAPLLDCKNALRDESVNGSLDLALEWLRKKGIQVAAKKQDRSAEEGLIGLKLDGDKAVMFEMKSETDFVARNEKFLNLLDEIMNVALRKDQTEVQTLLQQKLDERTVGDHIIEATATFGEKIDPGELCLLSKTNKNEILGSYLHGKVTDSIGTKASLVKLELSAIPSAETLPIAQKLANDLALQVVGGGCLFIDALTDDFKENERKIEMEALENEFREKAENAGKELDAKVLEKRVSKKVAKKLSQLEKEIVLLKQQMITSKSTVTQLIASAEKDLSAKVTSLSAVRFDSGGDNAYIN